MTRRRPRLRTVLLTVNLLILALPLAGIIVLRIYETALIQSTETQLVLQGVIVREAYLAEYRRLAPEEATLGAAVEDGELQPIPPVLDISKVRVRPSAEDATLPASPPDPLAAEAGSRIEPVLRAAARKTLSGIRIVDSHGIVVATSRSEAGLSLAGREEVRRALQGEQVSLLRERQSDDDLPPLQSISRGQRYRVFVALPVLDGDEVLGAVVLSRTPLDIVKGMYRHRRALFVLGAILLVVVVLVSTLTALTINRPVHALIDQAERITRGEPSEPPRMLGTHETARLSEALDRMARNLKQRADYIKTFAAHVSHEFKTPLTTIRGTVELLADHLDEMTWEERDKFLRNLTDSSNRLERLVGRMLELARADVSSPGDETTSVADALDCATRKAREAGLVVTVVHDDGVGAAHMSAETLEGIVANLLDNARQHGGAGVEVTIATRREEYGEAPVILLRISDDGPGISPANAERIFTPFFTTSRDRGGSGLGLSIVRSLLLAHGGSIELLPGERGATFLVRIPAA